MYRERLKGLIRQAAEAALPLEAAGLQVSIHTHRFFICMPVCMYHLFINLYVYMCVCVYTCVCVWQAAG